MNICRNILLILGMMVWNVASSLTLLEIWLTFVASTDNAVTVALCLVWVVGGIFSICLVAQSWKTPLQTEAEKLVQEALDERNRENGDTGY